MFIVATLRAANSTISINGTDDNGSPNTTTSPRGNPNTGLAMIILYAITGCVSGLFIVVILSGAIRAIRHPERYGPRARGPNGNGNGATGQSRTGGIGRAILDTFPIIKFGQGDATTTTTEPKASDVENQTLAKEVPMEMTVRTMGDEKNAEEGPAGTAPTHPTAADDSVEQREETSSAPGTQVALSSAPTSPRTSSVGAGVAAPEGEATSSGKEIKPGAIGHETCPICIVDFESGDDLRVLPCEGKHKFHQACVDPWLLELSSSCPLCREDFHALESMMAGNAALDPEASAIPSPDAPAPSAAGARSSRFSKYLKFARRRNRASQVGTSQSGPVQPDGTLASSAGPSAVTGDA